jgi:rhodanese-related sulfurtransferase
LPASASKSAADESGGGGGSASISAAALPSLDPIAPAAVGAALLVDLRAGMSYRKSHPRGAVWAIRPRLDAVVKAAAGRPLVLIADEEAVARAAALDLAAAGAGPLSLLDGGAQSPKETWLRLILIEVARTTGLDRRSGGGR